MENRAVHIIWFSVIFVVVVFYLSGTAKSQVPTYADVVYAEIEGQPLHLDLYLPENTTDPIPLVVWIHGGGWKAGSKWPVRDEVLELLDHNIAVASIDYRLTTDEMFSERIFPAQIQDVKGAVRLLPTHATTSHVDPVMFMVYLKKEHDHKGMKR